MAKRIDQQSTAARARKVVGHTAELSKAVVLALYRRITADRLPVGLADGSPVPTGRDSAGHTVAPGRIKAIMRAPNLRGGAEACRARPHARMGTVG